MKKHTKEIILILFVIAGAIFIIPYCQKNIVSIRQNYPGAETQQAADAKTLIIKRSQTQFIAKAIAGEAATVIDVVITEDDAQETEYNNEEIFYCHAEEQGVNRRDADAYWQILLKDNVFKDDTMRLTGLIIEDMDNNGQDDLLVMILDREYPAFYGYGRVWFYMNDDAPYCFDEEDCSYYGYFDFFAEDIDNDDHVELVLSTQGSGCGATGDFYKVVLKYKDHDITQMELPSDLDVDYDRGIDIAVMQEADRNRYSAYCPYFDEEVFFESENIFEPSERRCVGGNVRGYYDLRPVKYHGKNALQASEYLSGEGGNVHNVATANFIILWDKNGRPYIDKWWIETSGYTYANDKDHRMREE